MENRLLEVNHLASQSQIRLNDTNEVLKSLEERLRATEVHLNYRVSVGLFSIVPDVIFILSCTCRMVKIKLTHFGILTIIMTVNT